MNQETTEFIEGLAQKRLLAIDDLQANPAGLSWCRTQTALVDEAIQRLIRDSLVEFPAIAQLAVIATGGYGRSEMAPYSDVDITVVPPDESSPELDRAIRAFFQDLHHAIGTMLGLGIGYAYRLIADAPGLDAKTRTGLVDARLLAGPSALYQRLLDEMDATMAAGEFILAKIAEREAAFDKFNATPLVVEPNLKEGAGGIRCFHCANWIRSAIGEREAKPTKAYDRVTLTRNLLQAITGRPTDTLTRSRHEQIAGLLKRDQNEAMSEIAASANEIHKGYLAAKERLLDSRFSLSRSVVAIRGEARIAANADAGESAVGLSIATALGLRVSDLQAHPGSKTSGAAAAYAITTGEKTLRNLDRSGLLEHLLPELTRCRTLMPDDNVHRYTVFEHTMQLVRHLENLPAGSFLSVIREGLHDLEPLYLSALLHDVGKFDRDRPHSDSGADMAEAACRRWHLSAETIELVRWLVQEHLTMMRFVRLRDIHNPETIREFCGIVKDQTRLDLLTLLTWADVNAVAPEAWTSAQEAFLHELYQLTSEALDLENPIPLDAAQQRQRLMKQLRADVPETDLRSFVDSLPPYYLASTPPNLVKLHYQLVKKAEAGEPTVESFTQPELSATDITVCTKDEPGLLSRLLGIFYAYDLSVSGIRACTTETSSPVALDTFTVSYGGRPVPNATRAGVSSAILAMLNGERLTEDILRERGKDPDRDQEVFSYSFIAGSPAVLEVRAPRGRGMPYRFSRLIAAQGWNTFAARVGQWADSGAATFYIGGQNGLALSREDIDKVLKQPTL
jgi:[protein-PII] uridylyltransferase